MFRFRFHFAGLLVAMVTACGGGHHEVPEDARAPLIFFALDGLEWSVMQPLLAEGRLPVMAGLMSRGTYGYLESMTPTYSAVIWTTIATGKKKEKHGIEHFIYTERRAGRDEKHYYTSGHRKTKAFWNILSDYGLTVNNLGWWMTYPAEAINGVMVSQTNTTSVLHNSKRALWKGALFAGIEGQVHPPERQNDIMDLLDEVNYGLDEITLEIFGERPHPTTEFSQLMWDQTQWSFRADAVYIRAAREIVGRGPPFDMTAVYIGGPDVSGHRFWRYAYPEDYRYPPPPEQIENFGGLIDDYYIYVDGVIGDIVGAAPPGTAVMIVSDHGMHTINPQKEFSVDLPADRLNSGNHLDSPPGVFIAAGPAFRSGAASGASPESIDLEALPSVGGVFDVLPTLLAIKAIPIGRDFDGDVLTGVITPEWLARFPVKEISSHDDRAFEKNRRARMRKAIDQTERLEQLRSLGYIQ